MGTVAGLGIRQPPASEQGRDAGHRFAGVRRLIGQQKPQPVAQHWGSAPLVVLDATGSFTFLGLPSVLS